MSETTKRLRSIDTYSTSVSGVRDAAGQAGIRVGVAVYADAQGAASAAGGAVSVLGHRVLLRGG